MDVLSVEASSCCSPHQQLSCDELESHITELAAHIHAATYRLLVLIAEFDRREGWGGEGVRSMAHWLNWKCGIGMNAAREKVRVARALEALPKIAECFSRGELSYSKVRAMTRVANPQNQAERPQQRWVRHGSGRPDGRNKSVNRISVRRCAGSADGIQADIAPNGRLTTAG